MTMITAQPIPERKMCSYPTNNTGKCKPNLSKHNRKRESYKRDNIKKDPKEIGCKERELDSMG
jgi:hypothetical protein